MKIQYKNIADIKPYKNNPRKNDKAVKAVAESIKEFGFKIPIIVTEDGEIIAGHTRHKAALLLNMKKIPVIIASDLTPEQVKAFRLADNKTRENSEWIENLLREELEHIPEINMEVFGFLETKNVPAQIPDDDEIGASIVRAVCTNDQKDDIQKVLDAIDLEAVEKHGNENKNGNRLYGAIMTWQALKR